jgi:predicted ATPase
VDPLSRDLLEVIARAIVDRPVLLLLAYRPTEGQPQLHRVGELAYFKEIALRGFTVEEADLLIRRKLEALFGKEVQPPTRLIERFTAEAEGNPFYIEELVNYLQDRGIDVNDNAHLDHLELPSSLHSLVLSRIDQLTEEQRITLKVASVVGRVFRADTLWGAYAELGKPQQVKAHLAVLHRLDVTDLDLPEPELTYLFKHIVTQEVAYESLPFAVRSMLHGRVGEFLKGSFAAELEQHLDLLAYHYDRSDREPKKREYLLKAGVAAQGRYANTAAMDYYQRVQPLLQGAEQIELLTESLAINRELNEQRAIAFLLEYFAKLAALEGEPERVLRLVSAAAALRESLGAPLSPEELAHQEQMLHSVCQGEVGARRDAVWNSGKSMSLVAAIEYAVDGDKKL